MSDLSAMARGRKALATIADAIVEAAVDKSLRVAVDCPHSHLVLVGHLAQALHARGRACRCLPEEPVDAGGPQPDNGGSGATVVVITSGFTEIDRGVLRVNISVIGGGPRAREGDVSQQDTSDAATAANPGPDIILDCRAADGPVIRYLAAHLSPGSR